MSKKLLNLQWDLSPLYTSINDPKIDKDLNLAHKKYIEFENKYKKSLKYLVSIDKLKESLEDYVKLLNISPGKVISYLMKMQDLDAGNEKISQRINLLAQKIDTIENLILFYPINISKINKKYQNLFLKSEKLKKYNFFLKKSFEHGKYILSEKEEKILSLKSLTSYTLWTQSTKKIRDVLTIKYNNKDIPIAEADAMIETIVNRSERKKLYNKVINKKISISNIANDEINAIVINKKIDDNLRGYVEPFDATFLSYDNEKSTILSLVKAVNENVEIAHEFFKLKSKILKLKKMEYYDRNVTIGSTEKKINFSSGYKLLYKTFNKLSPTYRSILEKFIEKKQIDVFPKIGKRGGAYCSSSHQEPTYIFLNYINNFDSIMTFAHEMGHGIHSELTKKLPVIYQDYSISVAEVFSTLFENFVFHEQFKNLNKRDKIIALHDKIQDDINTIFIQIALFNFELNLHNTIRINGSMTANEIANLLCVELKKVYGPSVNVLPKNGYAFVSWPHIRYFFYTYTYSMGKIISSVLANKYYENDKFIKNITELMKLGGSLSPKDIFKTVDIDMGDSKLWSSGLKNIKADLEELKTLVG